VSPVVQCLAIGTPIAVLACLVSYLQRRSWRRPPRSAGEAQFRDWWAEAFPYPQLGVRAGADGWVYSNLTGRPLGQAAGARASIAGARPVTKIRPSTGWAVIYFADGSFHRQMFALSNLPEARAQADRFNARYQAHGVAGIFKRTGPASAAP
jgi:hypothetical protein